MSLVPVVKPDLAHRTFQGIVGVSVIGATGWIGEKVLGVVNGKSNTICFPPDIFPCTALDRICCSMEKRLSTNYADR